MQDKILDQHLVNRQFRTKPPYEIISFVITGIYQSLVLFGFGRYQLQNFMSRDSLPQSIRYCSTMNAGSPQLVCVAVIKQTQWSLSKLIVHYGAFSPGNWKSMLVSRKKKS